MNNLHIVILAAGKGTRMNSKLPKVLHPIGAQPMLEHVINTAGQLAPQSVTVVIGHGKDEVIRRLAHKNVNWSNKPNSSAPATPSKPPCPTCRPQAKRWCYTATYR